MRNRVRVHPAGYYPRPEPRAIFHTAFRAFSKARPGSVARVGLPTWTTDTLGGRTRRSPGQRSRCRSAPRRPRGGRDGEPAVGVARDGGRPLIPRSRRTPRAGPSIKPRPGIKTAAFEAGRWKPRHDVCDPWHDQRCRQGGGASHAEFSRNDPYNVSWDLRSPVQADLRRWGRGSGHNRETEGP